MLNVGGLCNQLYYIRVSRKYNVFEIREPCENKGVGKIKIEM
jgi:hypothetical protein